MTGILLAHDVAATARVVTTQGSPVLSVEGAFRSAGCMMMPWEVRRQLKSDKMAELYREISDLKLTRRRIRRLGWFWYMGDYDPATQKFEALDYVGSPVSLPADRIFVHMTGMLAPQLARVPGVEAVSFLVERSEEHTSELQS